MTDICGWLKLCRRPDDQEAAACIGASLLPRTSDGFVQAGIKLRPSREAELGSGTGSRPGSGAAAIRFVEIPVERDFEAGKRRDLMRQFANGNFASASQIYRLGLVVSEHSLDNAPGSVFHIEELADGRAIAPDLDHVFSRLERFDALSDERRNDAGRRSRQGRARLAPIFPRQR